MFAVTVQIIPPDAPSEERHQLRVVSYLATPGSATGSIQVEPPLGQKGQQRVVGTYTVPEGTIEIKFAGIIIPARQGGAVGPDTRVSAFDYTLTRNMNALNDQSQVLPSPDIVGTVLEQAGVVTAIDQLGSS